LYRIILLTIIAVKTYFDFRILFENSCFNKLKKGRFETGKIPFQIAIDKDVLKLESKRKGNK
jgi:hypothetical protein